MVTLSEFRGPLLLTVPSLCKISFTPTAPNMTHTGISSLDFCELQKRIIQLPLVIISGISQRDPKPLHPPSNSLLYVQMCRSILAGILSESVSPHTPPNPTRPIILQPPHALNLSPIPNPNLPSPHLGLKSSASCSNLTPQAAPSLP